MIKVDIYDKSFTISGHANSAPEGSDVVCAAVSSSGQLTAHILDKIADASIIAHKGYMYVKVERPSIYTKFVFKSFTEQMRALQDAYGKYVEVEVHESKGA